MISIHAPREGSDLLWEHWENLMGQFLSTLPARGATRSTRWGAFFGSISIHAPREGSDIKPVFGIFGRTKNFYPRSPRGERQG